MSCEMISWKSKIEFFFAAFSDLKSFYLFIYNMFMWVGYSYVFIAMIVRYIRDGEGKKIMVNQRLLMSENICLHVHM